METTNSLVPVIDTIALAEIIHQAPAILEENTSSHDKALEAGQKYLAIIEQSGMNDQLDVVLAGFLEKLRTTKKTMNDRRGPFTQIMTEVAKRFTSLEADIDPAGKSNIFFQIQTKRNEYASAKIAEQQKREREAREKLEREKEKISIESFAENSMRQAAATYTADFKAKMLNTFEGLSLQTIDHGAEQFSKIDQFNPLMLIMPQTPNYYYMKPEDVTAILVSIRSDESLISELREQFKKEIILLREELIDKIPSKKAELEAIAQAGEIEAKRLQDLAEQRKLDDQAKLEKETQEKAKQASDDALAKEQSAQLDATVNVQADLFQEAPKVKEGCEIIVKNNAAWQLIFMFWWEREGKSLPVDKIEKKTMLQMKSYCEKQAVATGEEIASTLIEYKITYKAK